MPNFMVVYRKGQDIRGFAYAASSATVAKTEVTEKFERWNSVTLINEYSLLDILVMSVGRGSVESWKEFYDQIPDSVQT